MYHDGLYLQLGNWALRPSGVLSFDSPVLAHDLLLLYRETQWRSQFWRSWSVALYPVCVVPSIGLHLNSILISTKDCESCYPRGLLILYSNFSTQWILFFLFISLILASSIEHKIMKIDRRWSLFRLFLMIAFFFSHNTIMAKINRWGDFKLLGFKLLTILEIKWCSLILNSLMLQWSRKSFVPETILS